MMRSPRPAELFLCPFFLAIFAGQVAGAAADGQKLTQLLGPDSESEHCRTITDSAARLRCYEATSNRSNKQQPSTAGAWRLVRTPNPAAGPDAVSIMHTADVSRSDLDLAGLMVRCGEGTTEVLIVLVRPFAPRAHPKVTIGVVGSNPLELTASVAAPGLLLLLPPEANRLAAGPWQNAPELTIAVADEHAPIQGVVPLAGLGIALSELWQNCPFK
jgi:hypothetical protein